MAYILKINPTTGKLDLVNDASGGSTLEQETPTGTVNDSNLSFDVANEPLFINVNGSMYPVGAGAFASYSAPTITLAYPVGTGGFIRSYYQTA